MTSLAIGSTVRINLRDGDGKPQPISSRAIVATINGDSVSLVRDDLAPVPLGRCGCFIVSPLFNSVGGSVEECECSVDDLMELLPFEDGGNRVDDHNSKKYTLIEKVELHKQHADVLLRLNDYTCAASHYEAALSLISSKSDVTIGGTCIVRRKGDAVIAEVDCIDSDSNQYDVTFVSQNGEEEEEATISDKDILLSVCSDEATYLQPRCLLNLSRCLIKLAEYDTTRGNVGCVGQTKHSTRQEKYRSAAVLGCSITMTLCEHLKENATSADKSLLDSLIGKARLIRSRAFIGRNMLRHAMLDAKKVSLQNPDDKEALKLMKDIKVKEARNKSLDKKISKEVCRWVKKATTTSEGAAAIGRIDDDEVVSESETTHLSELEDDFSFVQWVFKKAFMEIGAVVSFVVAMAVIMYSNYDIVQQQE